MKLLPIMLNLKERSILVIGGGTVALRKVEMLLEFGTNITLVSDTFLKEFDRLNVVKVKLKINDYSDLEPLIQGKILVVVATNDKKLNELAEQLCNKFNILCNRVDVKSSSAIFAATLKKKDVIVSVSSSGTVPSFSVFLRDKISDQIEEYMPALEVLKKLRETMDIKNYELRKKLFRELLNNEHFWEFVKKGDLQSAESVAKEIGGKIE